MRRAACLFLLAVLVVGGMRAQDDLRRPVPMTETEAQQWYTAYNNEYFDGKLPFVAIHFVRRLTDEKGAPLMGLTEGTPPNIYLTATYQDNRSISLETLLHEMSHLACTGQDSGLDQHHGCWLRTMHHLVDEGAMDDLL